MAPCCFVWEAFYWYCVVIFTLSALKETVYANISNVMPTVSGYTKFT